MSCSGCSRCAATSPADPRPDDRDRWHVNHIRAGAPRRIRSTPVMVTDAVWGSENDAPAVAWVDERLAAAACSAGRGRAAAPAAVGDRRCAVPDRRRARVAQGVQRRRRRSRPGCTRCSRAWSPDEVLVPLGVDAARGWVLLPDGGPTLGETASARRSAGLAARWCATASCSASWRRMSASCSRAGVADMRPEAMPRPVRGGAGGDARRHGELWERIAARRPVVAEWCARLAESPVPASLDHNDLHPCNVLGGDALLRLGRRRRRAPVRRRARPARVLRRLRRRPRRLPARVRRPGGARPTLELACRVATSPAR